MNNVCLRYIPDLLRSLFSMKRPVPIARFRVVPEFVDTLLALTLFGASEPLDSSLLLIIE
jgi:hypothetical protein